MSSVVVTRNNIETVPHGNIFAIVDNRSNVRDPRNPTGINGRIFVYDTDPFIKGYNFEDFPFIIVNFPLIEYSNWSQDGKVKETTWNVEIVIRAAKDGASNSNADIGKNDVLSIADDLHKTFNSETIKQSLRTLNIYDTDFRKESSDPIVIEDKPVFEAIYRLEFKTRLTVSE